MYVQVTLKEGEYFSLVEASALSISAAYRTGKLETTSLGIIEPAVLAFPESPIVYDFILKRLGLCPVRFRPNYYTRKCLWAHGG